MLLARPCLGCGTTVRGRSRCPRCATSTARGYDQRWRQTARAVIAASPRCAWCGTTADLTADHVVPLSKGGSSDPSNLRVLCRPHNSGRSNSAQES